MTPMVSAVWSCDPTTALAYPARYLFTFLAHHGLLGVEGSPQWRTVTGGSRSYVDKVAATLPDIRLSSPVTGVRRHADGVELTTTTGPGTVTTENFDAVVIATHPAQALRMLTDASPAEREALAGMPYSVNHTVFHRDGAVLPASDNAKASWNYRLPSCDARPDKVLVSYDMTRLQRLDPADGGRYIVSLGESELIADDTVIERMVYEHPQYTPDSLEGPAADPRPRRRPAGLRRRLPRLGIPRGRRPLRRQGRGPARTRLGRRRRRAERGVPAVPSTRTCRPSPRRAHERTRQPSTARPSRMCGAPR